MANASYSTNRNVIPQIETLFTIKRILFCKQKSYSTNRNSFHHKTHLIPEIQILFCKYKRDSPHRSLTSWFTRFFGATRVFHLYISYLRHIIMETTLDIRNFVTQCPCTVRCNNKPSRHHNNIFQH